MKTTIPFSGFYETLWSDLMDREIEFSTEYFAEQYPDIPQDEIKDILFRFADFGAMEKMIAARYADEFENLLNTETGLQIRLDYESMDSPKEYNFTTDRIFADITLDDVKKLLKRVGWQALCKQAKKDFTSRPGFMSYYSPHPANWGKVAEWDHNQVGCLLRAAVAEIDDWDMSIYYAIDDLGLCDHYDHEKVEWELENFFENEEDPCDLSIPFGVSDVSEYVKKFDELNNLKG